MPRKKKNPNKGGVQDFKLKQPLLNNPIPILAVKLKDLVKIIPSTEISETLYYSVFHDYPEYEKFKDKSWKNVKKYDFKDHVPRAWVNEIITLLMKYKLISPRTKNIHEYENFTKSKQRLISTFAYAGYMLNQRLHYITNLSIEDKKEIKYEYQEMLFFNEMLKNKFGEIEFRIKIESYSIKIQSLQIKSKIFNLLSNYFHEKKVSGISIREGQIDEKLNQPLFNKVLQHTLLMLWAIAPNVEIINKDNKKFEKLDNYDFMIDYLQLIKVLREKVEVEDITTGENIATKDDPALRKRFKTQIKHWLEFGGRNNRR